MEPIPFHARALLFPRAIDDSLRRLKSCGALDREEVPNLWQVQLGVLRMWHRILFRSETIGQSSELPVRSTLRARMLQLRPLRFPFLLRERAVHPLDFSGLASSGDRIRRHLLGAHHDGVQFLYDLQLLELHPGMLERVRREAAAIVAGDHPRAHWLRDLTVYQRYHENLLAAVEGFIHGSLQIDAEQQSDPDISFLAYMRWCARQPKTPRETMHAWRSGRYSIAEGQVAEGQVGEGQVGEGQISEGQISEGQISEGQISEG